MNAPLQIQSQIPLTTLNTFGIAAQASHFVRIDDLTQLRQLQATLKHDPRWRGMPRFILGGGSNVILAQNLSQLVVQMAIPGRQLISESETHFLVSAGAGENWHEFVLWTLQQGYPGLENLSLIPGTVGASPIQNIGAYGVEMQDYFHHLVAMHLDTGEMKTFTKQECAFAYRDSIFKQTQPNPYVIVEVVFALPKKWQAQIQYGDVAARLRDQGDSDLSQVTALAVSQAICHIRQSKLPDPAVIGNAGSFFKNPIVEARVSDQIRANFPNCVSYPQTNGQVKLAAGWLIEQCGWKGKRSGRVAVYEKQALVLVNAGGASAQDVQHMAQAIQADVKAKFDVALEIEPVFVD